MKSLAIAVVIVALPARAEPPKPKPPPWLAKEGALKIDVNVENDASKGDVPHILAVAPDAWYGATDELTIGVVHSKFATTGFRGSAGGSPCISGTSNGCAHSYDNVGVEAWQSVVPGQLALGGGLHALHIATDAYALKLGLKGRIKSGMFSVSSAPSIFIGAKKEDSNVYYVPIGFGVAVIPELTFGIGTGIKGGFDNAGKSWQVPIGASLQFSSGQFVLGASWVFGQIISGAMNAAPPARPVEGPDLRVVQVWASFSTK